MFFTQHTCTSFLAVQTLVPTGPYQPTLSTPPTRPVRPQPGPVCSPSHQAPLGQQPHLPGWWAHCPLQPWYTDSWTWTQIVTDLECQHFQSVGFWLAESGSCLDQLVMTVPPCTRLGNLKNGSQVQGQSFSSSAGGPSKEAKESHLEPWYPYFRHYFTIFFINILYISEFISHKLLHMNSSS